jgi:putative heme-binding domain-containing protein
LRDDAGDQISGLHCLHFIPLTDQFEHIHVLRIANLREALVEPSKVISDQYKASVINTAAGQNITGKIVSEVNGKLTVVTDPEDSTKVAEIDKDDVVSLRASNLSLMPEKLLNELNENEVLDLLAFMLSRGDPNHPMFKKK